MSDDVIQVTSWQKTKDKKHRNTPSTPPPGDGESAEQIAPPWWDVFVAVEQERQRQLAEWGVQHLLDGTSPTLFKGWADEYKRQNDARQKAGKTGVWSKVLLEEIFEALSETDEDKMAHELLQSAAVIVAWLEDLASRNTTPKDAA